MNNDTYEDIIGLPHYEPKHHNRMPMRSRAAQFAPFAALTGHDAAIAETSRLTSSLDDIGAEAATMLNRKMALLRRALPTTPLVEVTYFVPDDRKSGGAYCQKSARLREIDDYNFQLVMTDGSRVPIQHILDIDGEVFAELSE